MTEQVGHCMPLMYSTQTVPHYITISWIFSTQNQEVFFITGTYKLHPLHCKMPTIPKGDQTIIAATDLVRALQDIVPTSINNKYNHTQYL